MFIVKIDNEYVLDDESGELRPELGMKKYAKKFNTEKEAYSYARKYFKVPKSLILYFDFTIFSLIKPKF